MKKKYLIINFIWLSIIALIIIIYLLTVKFGANDELVKYLSFGLTITSLFVGLIAIFQSFFSGDSIRRSLDELDNASATIATNSANLHTIVEQFNLKFGEVPVLMSDIKKQLGVSNATLSGTKQNVDEVPKSLPKDLVTNFLKSTSPAGKIILFAVLKSHETKKPFKLRDLFEKNNQLEIYANYSHGFLMACAGLGLFNSTQTNENWSIKTISTNFKTIEEIVNQTLKSGTAQTWYLFFEKTKKIIDAYFEEEVEKPN